MKKVSVVYHSGYGHTAFIAKKVAEGITSAKNIEVQLVEVGNKSMDWEILQNSDAIVFGSPTYMGNVSAQFKAFMDESSKAWMTQSWANKLAAGFTVSGSPSGDKLNTLQALTTFALQHGMLWVGYNTLPETYGGKKPEEARNRLGSFTGLMVQASNETAEKAFYPGDIESALDFGKRIGTVLSKNIV
ncbi:MAG: flavodoxin family protein [Bacteriovoracaceae bacterium]|nr:flavodoxin family protein [Bacteriovoracaceae bacterium]